MLDIAFGAVALGNRHRLDVDGDHHVRRLAVGERGPARHFNDILDMRGAHDARRIGRRVHEQFVELDILLGQRFEQVVMLCAGDREDRLTV